MELLQWRKKLTVNDVPNCPICRGRFRDIGCLNFRGKKHIRRYYISCHGCGFRARPALTTNGAVRKWVRTCSVIARKPEKLYLISK